MRKKFKISLDPAVYSLFRLNCRRLGRKPNIVIENLMVLFNLSPHLILRMAEKAAEK